jgi:integrase
MPSVRLRGLNQVRKRLKGGGEVVYWYAWKGGPRLEGRPGSPEFVASYNAAVADRKAPRNDTLAGLVTLYKSKPEYLNLRDSTKKQWSRWLDKISRDEEDSDIGGIPIRLLDDKAVRAALMDWRDAFAAHPRAADYGVQVLSRVLSFGVERGVLNINRAAGIPHLYHADRSDMIWEPEAMAAFRAAAPPSVSQALRLACLTGLRRGDLVKLRWAQVSDISIETSTGKSGGKRRVVAPVLRETRELLQEIGRRDATESVLLNAHGNAWRPDSLTERVTEFARKVGLDRTLHDARGTFCTRMCLAGLTDEQIADLMGWERERVRQIRARYVDQDRIVQALIRQVAANESGPKTPNFRPTKGSRKC